ncbi:MAG: spermidine/putrescine ABC transporter substrate-binding protein [Alphaproteobacteria bacterium]|nr:spermidine/putrescine ABC transporter substrate-binding protein [Alphaproteobacteria bacterium]
MNIKPSGLIAIILVLGLLAGGVFMAAQNSGPKLYVYTWDTYADNDLFKKFQKETGIKVITEIYSSNDALLAKLKSGARYDIVVPSGNYIPLLLEENLLQSLPADISTLGEKLADTIKEPVYDPGYKYAMPLFYGTTGIAVNTKMVSENITSWSQFFDRPNGETPSLGVLDDTSTVMALASIALGRKNCDGSDDTLKALQDLLVGQKPQVKVYGSTGYFERMAAGEVGMQMAWSGDVYTARQENPDLKYIYPVEGVELWMDSLAIPANAQNTEAAAKFIAFVMDPKNQAAYAEFSGQIPTHKDTVTYLSDDIRSAPEFNIPETAHTYVSFACPAEVVQAYGRIWESLLR